MRAEELRRVFTEFFASRDHTVVPSASLIPHDPSLLFTVAGMVPFKPYFVGDEEPPHRRATSVQRCVRAGGKHNDLDEIGRTSRHLTFFEMLGNFSFGDYFKAEAIAMAWELFTGPLGLDPERLWVTVHVDDDEAADIWHDQEGVPRERIQRFDEDNFWKMGDTGPCGPCSEIFWDKGEAYGAGGGPAEGDEDRFVEIWNLVFMQYDQGPDGERTPLPKPSIDTGSGLERVLSVLQGKDSVFELDEIRPLIAAAESVTGRTYGHGEHGEDDVSLRIIADHARTFTHLISDGIVPSNEERGYVLRAIIRRAVQRSWMLGLEEGNITVPLARAVAEQMGQAYPDLTRNLDHICDTVEREEARFRQTLRSGMRILDDEFAALGQDGTLPGEVAFKLHDTFGFPIQLTTDIARATGHAVDHEGFEVEMAAQRDRARAARKAAEVGEDRTEAYRQILEAHGADTFTGYETTEGDATVTEVLVVDADASPGPLVEVFLDVSPFYAEAGGQVGDTGTITTDTGRVHVTDTTYALPSLRRHVGHLVEGDVEAGQTARADVDAPRRDAIRRHHTGTHLLHWALRQVLGDHVKQAGSVVQPDRLRFDFSHHAPVSRDEISRIEALANGEVLRNEGVDTELTSKADADAAGVIAFFGDKYGDTVRVLRAGASAELCGGTHVTATGDIGPIRIVSEGSIGANTRRIEAVTGAEALAVITEEQDRLHRAADLLETTPDALVDQLERKLAELTEARAELKHLSRAAAAGEAEELAREAADGVVVARRDGVDPKAMRELAAKVRDVAGVRAVVLGGVSDADKGKVALVAAVTPESGLVASELLADAARLVGGGGGKGSDIANAGGREPGKVDDALAAAAAAAGVAG